MKNASRVTKKAWDDLPNDFRGFDTLPNGEKVYYRLWDPADFGGTGQKRVYAYPVEPDRAPKDRSTMEALAALAKNWIGVAGSAVTDVPKFLGWPF